MTGNTYNNGRIASEETRKKMSNSQKTRIRKPHSEEAKQKMREAKKGKPSNRLGAVLSEETKQKMRKSKLLRSEIIITTISSD